MPLTTDFSRSRARFRLSGADVEPINSERWRNAGDDERRAYYEILARHARVRKDRELAMGWNVDGEALARLKWPRTGRYRGATGPPLMPFREFSRTRRFLSVRVATDRVTFYWRGGWSRIVYYHAKGMGRYGPIAVRNVVGITEAGVEWAVNQARREYAALFPERDDPPPPAARIRTEDRTRRDDRRLLRLFQPDRREAA